MDKKESKLMNHIKQNTQLLLRILFALLLSSLVFYNVSAKNISVPEIKEVKQISNKEIYISGKSTPNISVEIYLNGQKAGITQSNTDGFYKANLSIGNSKTQTITSLENYYWRKTAPSKALVTELDLEPPTVDSLFANDVPPTTRAENITLTGKVNPEDKLYVNDVLVSSDVSGNFSHIATVNEGINNFNYSLTDKYGNKSELLLTKSILKDTTPPSIGYCGISNTECVNLTINNWDGYIGAYNKLPISGTVASEIKSVTIEGKKVYWDKNGKVSTKLNLYVKNGLNKYKVIATDINGNSAEGTIETTAKYTYNTPTYNSGYYNIYGNWIQSPSYFDYEPSGATAICRDGTYSFSQSRSGTCSYHGGVSQWLY